MSIEILIVENEATAAIEYANLIRKRTGFRVEHVATSREALEIIENHQIKVVVLDQKLGSETGTSVFRAIRAKDARVKAIMFTGQAEKDEVAKALHSGYNDYLDKARVADLPSVVSKWFHAYQLEAALLDHSQAPASVYRKRQWRAPWKHAVEYYVSGVEVVDSRYIDEDSWRMILEINAGEQREFTRTTRTKTVLQFEEESTSTLKAGLGLKSGDIAALTSSLESVLTNRFKSVSTEEQEETDVEKRTYSLPAEPVNPAEFYIVKRRLEETPEWRRLKLYIRSDCTCCGNSHRTELRVNQATGKVASRVVNVMSDGTTNIIPAGTFS
ncbi:response regulator [Arthrobacter sp. P2b]|uniref:response regulator n=1 Tax=Arthrobacter sp. P2b TaxID=1938741 RepID=UPI0009A8F4A6|nr:response regulator [Arthrobacter sp. P2b]SLK12037.1 Response regulator receiver domain-containing protein [Arthrobacter sp. P2b]